MSLQDSLFSEDVEYDVTVFSRDKRRKRVLVFPPVNNYRRYIIHQLVQDRFPDLFCTFSIGQGAGRRTVVCFKTDLIRKPELNGAECTSCPTTETTDSKCEMGVEGQRSPSPSPEHTRIQRQVKTLPAVEIYRPPAARRVKNNNVHSSMQPPTTQTTPDLSSLTRNSRQKRPDRAVYVPRHRRSLATDSSPQPTEMCRTNYATQDQLPLTNTADESVVHNNICSREQNSHSVQRIAETSKKGSSVYNSRRPSLNSDKTDIHCNTSDRTENDSNDTLSCSVKLSNIEACQKTDVGRESSISDQSVPNISMVTNSATLESEDKMKNVDLKVSSDVETSRLIIETADESITLVNTENEMKAEVPTNEITLESTEDAMQNKSNKESDSLRATEYTNSIILASPNVKDQKPDEELLNRDEVVNHKNRRIVRQNVVSDVLIISDNTSKKAKDTKEVPVVPMTPPEKKVKKVERPKSKPAPPPSPPLKINRDECDWDSLFDDNGDCLDPTLMEELTSAVGEVTIEQPKNDYKTYSKQVEVSSDEFAHVVEIYNFPSDFKTSDLATVFSPFKNGGFELKWVDDTHCLGVFSSPLIAAEVLASDHPFVKTRPLSEATALSKTKARRSAEFLQPYRSRPETCAALARRLVTGALGVKLATARQEREQEKNILREAKEKKRLANKQREDAWEGIIPEK